ncbi:MAG: hypothetical protein A2X46_15135 [Lentisphaerae bacterium GWF2_57_35]|nr:MAG: hypothetical protein A2X46_15135 [Lentisphaerae bacterium GWF2_57_35]
MLHEPAVPVGKDPAQSYKMRLGVWMVLSYSLFYAGFVAINLLKPLVMEKTVLAGLNLATVYGFALILVAFLQAMIYNAMCSAQERKLDIPKNPMETR